MIIMNNIFQENKTKEQRLAKNKVRKTYKSSQPIFDNMAK